MQDPSGTELEALIHGNRLIKAAISTADGLRDLWASPAVKDMLRKRGIHAEVAPSYPENTAILNQQLLEDEGVLLPTTELLNEHHQPQKRTKKQKLREKAEEDRKIILKINLKRIREQQAVDDVISKRRKTTTPSSSWNKGVESSFSRAKKLGRGDSQMDCNLDQQIKDLNKV